MLARISSEPGMKPIIKTRVMREIDPAVLQAPFDVPENLRHECKLPQTIVHPLDGFLPERYINRRRAIGRQGPFSPGPLEYIRLDQHRHVTPDPVTAGGHAQELLEHRSAAAHIPVVELDRVWPAWKI